MKNILVCPLDWGMGHATRVRNIARELHNKGHNIIVAASEPLLEVFDNTVCSEKVVFNSLRTRYSRKLPQYLVILLQAPLVLIQFLADRYQAGRLAKKYRADIVISDNRFGCNTRGAYSIYITHQLNIKVPGRSRIFARILSSMHGFIASSYNECWIPDIPGGLAGDLTIHSSRLKTRYIGILSMLNTCEEKKPEEMPGGEYYAVIISGPEPQRTLLEEKLVAKLSGLAEEFVIAGGKAGSEGEKERGREGENIWYYDYLKPGEIKYIINNSRGVICRSGYSTLMDLAVIGKGAIVIPTPGQTEQEYLAKELDKKGWVKECRQNELENIKLDIMPESPHYGDIREKSEILLDKALSDLLSISSSRSAQ